MMIGCGGWGKGFKIGSVQLLGTDFAFAKNVRGVGSLDFRGGAEGRPARPGLKTVVDSRNMWYSRLR